MRMLSRAASPVVRFISLSTDAVLRLIHARPSSEPGVTEVPAGPPAVAADGIVSIAPNPFNPQTTVRFALAAAGRARLGVYDLSGRLVASLVDADLPAGAHVVVWNGRGRGGAIQAAGTYFCRLETAAATTTRKIALVK